LLLDSHRQQRAFQEGIHPQQPWHKQEATVAILDVGWMDHRVEQQTQRIDENMPLFAADPLACVITIGIDASPAFLGTLHALAFRPSFSREHARIARHASQVSLYGGRVIIAWVSSREFYPMAVGTAGDCGQSGLLGTGAQKKRPQRKPLDRLGPVSGETGE
jgi:hypothetical protein